MNGTQGREQEGRGTKKGKYEKEWEEEEEEDSWGSKGS